MELLADTCHHTETVLTYVLCCASITIYCSLLLCDCYRYPNPVSVRPGPSGWLLSQLGSAFLLTWLPVCQGERCYTYTMSVRRYLGASRALGWGFACCAA